MKWNFNDPTAGKDDMVPLTGEDLKAVAMAAYIMGLILLVAGGIIYSML